MLFFPGNRAYRIKKLVDLGFLDLSTLAKRRAACRREVVSRGSVQEVTRLVDRLLASRGPPVHEQRTRRSLGWGT